MPKNFPLSQGEDDFHSKRSRKTPVQELLQVGDDFIPEAEIVGLWYGGKHGAELHLTGDRSLPVPENELDKVQDFLEARNESIGLHRRLFIGGERIVQSDIFEVVEKECIPHVILKDGRVIKAKPLEISGLKATVERNNKLRENSEKPIPPSPDLPVYCNSCKSFSTSKLIGFGAGIQVKNVTVPCPFCGQQANIPDGQYLNVEGALKFINDSNLTAAELATLRRLIGEAIENNISAPQLIINIRNEVPRASGLGQFLTGGNVLAFLGMLIALLSWRFPVAPPEKPQASPQASDVIPSKRSVRRERHKGKPKTKTSRPHQRNKH